MIKLTPGELISSIMSLGLLYLVMESVHFAGSDTRIGMVIEMTSAAIVWLVMIQFMAKTVNTFLYENFISRFIR